MQRSSSQKPQLHLALRAPSLSAPCAELSCQCLCPRVFVSRVKALERPRIERLMAEVEAVRAVHEEIDLLTSWNHRIKKHLDPSHKAVLLPPYSLDLPMSLLIGLPLDMQTDVLLVVTGFDAAMREEGITDSVEHRADELAITTALLHRLSRPQLTALSQACDVRLSECEAKVAAHARAGAFEEEKKGEGETWAEVLAAVDKADRLREDVDVFREALTNDIAALRNGGGYGRPTVPVHALPSIAQLVVLKEKMDAMRRTAS